MGPGAGLPAYASLAYHLPLSIAFSTRRRAPFVWGGCMLLRARELAGDPRGLLKARARQHACARRHACPRLRACPRCGALLLRPAATIAPSTHTPQAWRDGGYSDDMLLAAACSAAGLPVATHRAALLPQLLGPGGGWRGYWNYLRRQLYVLDTYHDAHCRRCAARGGVGRAAPPSDEAAVNLTAPGIVLRLKEPTAAPFLAFMPSPCAPPHPPQA